MTTLNAYQPTATPVAPAAPVRAQAAYAPVDPGTWRGDSTDWSAKVAPSVPGGVAGYVAHAGAPGFLGGAPRVRTRRSVRSKSSAGFGGNMIAAVKGSVLVGGLLSIWSNGKRYMNKQQDLATTAKNVTGDVAVAAVGGAAGALASTIATPLLAGVLGPASLLVTLGSIGLGMVGFALAENWLRNTPFFQQATNTVHSTIAKISG